MSSLQLVLKVLLYWETQRGAVCMAVLWKEEVEEQHMGCGREGVQHGREGVQHGREAVQHADGAAWKGGCAAWKGGCAAC